MAYFKRYFWIVFHTQNHECRESLLTLGEEEITVAGDGCHVVDIFEFFGFRKSTATDCYLLAVFDGV